MSQHHKPFEDRAPQRRRRPVDDTRLPDPADDSRDVQELERTGEVVELEGTVERVHITRTPTGLGIDLAPATRSIVLKGSGGKELVLDIDYPVSLGDHVHIIGARAICPDEGPVIVDAHPRRDLEEFMISERDGEEVRAFAEARGINPDVAEAAVTTRFPGHSG